MESVAEQDLSVVLSSHLISDLERVCDYLIVLVGSRIRVAGPVEELLAAHHLLSGPRRDPGSLPGGMEVIWPATPTCRAPCWYAAATRSWTRPGRSPR